MKSLISIIIIVIVGLFTAFMIGFDVNSSNNPLVYDDEQNGLEQQIVIKFSHVVAENTPKGLAAQLFAKLVKEKTDGKVKVEVFPNGILYSDSGELDALITGEVQIIAPAYSKLSGLIPAWQVLDLPFAFPDHESVRNALDGEIGASLFQMLEEHNLKGLAFWSNGFKQISTNTKPLILPADFAGQEFRIMPSSVIEAQFEAFQAKTRRIPFNQTYHNLESGLIDGQENTISNIYSKRFYAVQKFLTISNHGYLGYSVIINKTFWDELPEDVKLAIDEAMNEATLRIRGQSIEINEQQLKQIREYPDIQIHDLSPAEKQLWIEKLEPVYDQFEPVIGEELMHSIKGLRERNEN